MTFNKSLLFLSFLLSFQIVIAQCNQVASNFGNGTNPMYNITGDIDLTLNTNNTVKLSLGANFNTNLGPDVRAYLVNSNGASDVVLQNANIQDLDSFEFGLVSSLGAQSFTVSIPNGMNISDFDKVFFYCLNFDVFWDFGSFTPFSPTNCNSILSVDNNTLNKISLYPNPAQNIVKISGHIPNLEEISIYNTLGKIIYVQKDNLGQNINVSSLGSGLYIMTIKTPERMVFKRFIKQ